jgi:aminoglycoside 6'-N-acetyltransferase I
LASNKRTLVLRPAGVADHVHVPCSGFGDVTYVSSRHGLLVRTAESGDVEGLAELLQTAGVTVPLDRLASRLSAIQGQPGALFIADEWGPPSGLIAVHWHAVLTADLKVGWISTLLVDPARRRNGVARVLLKAASQAARSAGCGELVLSSPVKPGELRAFCLATGFVEAGEVFSRPLRKRS